MKVWKKNLVAAAILVTVCAGIYLNWMYTEENIAVNLTDTVDAEKVMSDDALVLSGDMAAIALKLRRNGDTNISNVGEKVFTHDFTDR